MEIFVCKECGKSYGWTLEGNKKDTCSYCSGAYIDGTPCSGGRKK